VKFVQSLGAKLALVCLACLALLAVAAAAINAVGVNALKEHILQDSLRLAEEKGKQLAAELGRLQGQVSPQGAGGAQNPDPFRERIRWFIEKNEEILLAGVIQVVDGKTKVIVGDFRDPQARQEILAKGDSYETWLRSGDEEALKVILQRSDLPVITAQLDEEALPGLRLAYLVSDSAIYKRIEAAGAKITRRVALMTGLLSASLILAFLAAWALFRGQVRLLQEKEESDKMAYVGALASGLAHEIRNPLNAMSVNLGVIGEELEAPQPDSPERVAKIVQHMSAEVGQLDGVLASFLTFALPRDSRRERTRPAQAIREALESLESQIAQRRVDCALDLDENLEIEANPVGLRQAIHNVALNAVQAMDGPKRRLTVRCWKENRHAQVAIEDTGVGIEPQDLERVFEVFYSARPGGSGFGLPIAQRIVREHGGRIWAQSTLGKGSTFHMEFPLP